MSITDIGPEVTAFNIEDETKANDTYRTVAWTGRYLQVTLMSIPVGESIGLEVHPETDQFLRLEAGSGRVEVGPEKDVVEFTHEVEDDWAILIPAGSWHNVINTGDEPLRLYSIYAPVHHDQAIVHETRADSERDEAAGTDNPPSWTVQPGV